MQHLFPYLYDIVMISMGKQTGILLFSGKLGDQVGYYRRNKKGKKEWWTRRAPQTVRQTTATQKAATDFGTASKCSRLLRHSLRPWLQHYGYHFDHNRLNKAFINIINADTQHTSGFRIPAHHHLQSLCGFNFNGENTTRQYLTAPPQITTNNNTVAISLPGLHTGNNNTHKGISHICVKAIMLPFTSGQDNLTPIASETVTVTSKDILHPITLTLPVRQEACIIALEIQCGREINGHIEISSDCHTAAMDIIAVLPATKPIKIRKTYRNKTPRLRMIPLCQPAGRLVPKPHTSLPPPAQ